MGKRNTIVSQAKIKRTLQPALSVGLRIDSYEVDHATGRIVVILEGASSQGVGPDPDELLK